ncbi:MAG: hypothetical protein AAGI88_07155 [Pseudomonadota bacterium]
MESNVGMDRADNELSVDPIAEAGRKAKGKRPQFFELEESERLMGILMAVVGELAVARERIDTLERVLDTKGVLEQSEIEDFKPDRDQARQRGLLQQEYIARVLRVVQQEREALEEARKQGPAKTLEEVSQHLGNS